jgi:hypothetical protein
MILKDGTAKEEKNPDSRNSPQRHEEKLRSEAQRFN